MTSRPLPTVSAVLFALAGQHLEQADALVLEGNFRPGEHEAALRALIARHALQECIQVLCRAPETLRQERLLARAADAARHPGHHDAAWVAPADQRSDAFLELAGPRFTHDSGATDRQSGCALIRSLAKRQLV